MALDWMPFARPMQSSSSRFLQCKHGSELQKLNLKPYRSMKCRETNSGSDPLQNRFILIDRYYSTATAPFAQTS